jgi:AmmeMemoRadiSam system protein A
MLDEDDQRALLALARASLESLLTATAAAGASDRPALQIHTGAFVTLHVDGRLRGCLGHTESQEPLWRTVEELAVSAATRDPRFPPLAPDELPRTAIEISVLTPRQVVTDPSEIEVGRDGLVITWGGHRGLLLPQVPVEWGWDRETFLAETCRKAGLPIDTWKRPGVRIERFQAQVFGER